MTTETDPRADHRKKRKTNIFKLSLYIWSIRTFVAHVGHSSSAHRGISIAKTSINSRAVVDHFSRIFFLFPEPN